MKKIKSALISVYNKEGLLPILEELTRLGVKIISTGGTYTYIKSMGFQAVAVEELTSYPSIFDGRVKTLHPAIFGGILNRRDNQSDMAEKEKYKIEDIDLVIVDLYPFSETVASGASEAEIIEKIDIGGISLIRAAAKNFEDVLVVPSKNQYSFLLDLLMKKNGYSELQDRKLLAIQAFNVSSAYDTEIHQYFSSETHEFLKRSFGSSTKLRYGENPHQQAMFYGDIDEAFFQHHGKQISYNNLLDIDSAFRLINDFKQTTVAIIKHLNPCGLASRENLTQAWKDALAGDPVSAFGGIIVTNEVIDLPTAQEMDKLFFEVVIAPGYHANALEVLKTKKNRIILQLNNSNLPKEEIRTSLFGLLVQDRDTKSEIAEDLKYVTEAKPTAEQIEDMLFANKIVKHLKSNAIVIVKNKQMIGAGMGQTSRIDALKQAISKAKEYGFDLKGSVLSSDAYFPFADSVETAFKEGISAIIQPGGSVRDQDSIDFCNQNGLPMVFTGYRHFKH
ncbi:MAG TPA: bifunctional phosphoribosylaminoimidazolecarboxamide formyltransferase/IMP cyclohydrolase [Bacteroidia bacterium]|nr:bifunctional phosphoribosylaminoimidazolecarboxamide formyltransferase/IMP cyclohydrolase [Bacteroidia bacterium]HRS58073.1 bifunctional phosphoribosylaminoimidazolecarboxamide formyltransferase/IMP cyclohydrolase [Bacteroidia bacterium]HRU66907.1 bifunctional phosphoribosylaminoimidazolecarboxamide formyltransferase/IMP cyclohydrolase [Bacteroidia bacterium]